MMISCIQSRSDFEMIHFEKVPCILVVQLIIIIYTEAQVTLHRREAYQRRFLGWGNEDLPIIEANNNRNYYVETILKADYFGAQYYCKRHGMELVSIESVDENESLKKAIENLDLVGNYQFLTSGVKIPDVGIWSWMSSGKPVKYRNFKVDYDKYGTGNRCISAIFDEPSKGLNMMWVSNPCDEYKFFICEQKNKCSSSYTGTPMPASTD